MHIDTNIQPDVKQFRVDNLSQYVKQKIDKLQLSTQWRQNLAWHTTDDVVLFVILLVVSAAIECRTLAAVIL